MDGAHKSTRRPTPPEVGRRRRTLSSEKRASRSRVPIWCEIVCRSCAHTTDGQWAWEKLPKRDLVKRAREAGYIFKYDEAFCSPACVNRFENEKRQENQHGN